MNAVIHAKHIRQAVGDFHHHHTCALDDVAVPQIGSAEIEITVFIHAAGFQHHHIHRRDEAPVVVGNLAQIHRQVMDATGIVHFAVVAREMHAEQMKVLALGVLIQHRTRTHGDAGAELHVMQFVFAQCQRLVEHIGLAQGGTIVDPHARLDQDSSLFGRNGLGRLRGLAQRHGH